MSDILEEIQELSNKFSNLFEVEGLGDPAVDVPPSTNKIKRDRKTKDGKVEVVSVEDELFPYDGNKREQYRQKILDTINGMIQGTATLEDLLQIVRQKKAPLKEAMEVLENLGSYIQDKYGDSKKGKELYNKYFQNFNKEANAAITKERVEDIEKKDKKPLEHYVKKLLDKRNETKNSKGEFKTDNRRDMQKKAPLKEAMEVLEELLSEGYNLHQVVARAHAKKGHRFFKDNGLPKVSVSPEDIEKEEKLAKILGDKDKTKKLADKALEVPDSKEYKKHVSGDARNIFVGGNTDSNLGYKDKVALSQDINGSRAEERQINKSKGRHRRKLAKMNKSEALEEAIELMEELLLERNKENRQKKENWELKTNKITKKEKKAIQDYAKQEGDEAKYHRAAAADYDHIYSQQPAQAPDGSPNSVAAYFNGKYQEMLRNKGRNEQNIADEVEPLTKKLKNRKHSFHDRVRGWTESEALKETIEVFEDLIDTINKAEQAGANMKGKKTKVQDTREKEVNQAAEREGTSPLKIKGRRLSNDDIIKAQQKDQKADKGSKIVRGELEVLGYDREDNPVYMYKKPLKEAFQIMEEIINEVSMKKWVQAAKNSLPKRKEDAEAAKKAVEQGWEEYDKLSRKHPEEEPALYRLAQANAEAGEKAEDRADHAYAVTRLINDKADGNVSGLVHGKANANKVIKAAKKVQDKREDEFGRNPEKRTFLRSGKANQLAATDPVKSRNEADQ